jgi:gamma-glutamyltranspeptidase/glutathione hydrolase
MRAFATLRRRIRHLRRIALLLPLALCACDHLPARAPAYDAPAAPREARPAVARQHMVAAANPLAAQAGLQMLRAGGSAVDATIAMQMVLTLVEPQSSGIGGGAFLLHWDGRRVQSFDGRETAPAAVDEALFLNDDGRPMGFVEAAVGGRAVGVPGVLRMLEAVHRQHGRLPWSALFDPAIRLAQDGFPMPPRLHAQLSAESHLARSSPAAAALYYAPDGSVRPAGTVLRNPELAQTFRLLSRRGADGLYRGAVAAEIVSAVRTHPTHPGRLSAADLAGYRAVERPPLCTDYRRWRICGMGPPSSGGLAVAQMLGMLEHRPLSALAPRALGGRLQPDADAVHLFSEVGRLAFADRNAYVADSDFVAVDVAGLTDPAYLTERAARVSDRSMGRATAGQPPGVRGARAEDASTGRPSTSHLVAVDRYGNAVSMTTSIEDAFGARIMVRGFLLNNQLTDFSFLPREGDAPGAPQPDGALAANRVQPGKRPRSSMAPTLVFERASGELVAAVGSPGGPQIINYVAKTLIGLLDWGLDIQQAIELPNFGSRNGPTELERDRADPGLAEALRARGHEVRLATMTSGLHGIQRVRRPDGSHAWIGGADPRRDGVALGD